MDTDGAADTTWLY